MFRMNELVRLAEPDESRRDEFIAYCEEFRDAGEHVVHGQLADAQADFASLVRRWAQHARGENLTEGQVPQTVCWLMLGSRILGTARFRHHLTEATFQEGGHVGYEVRPSERRRGYATRLLALVLEKVRQEDLKRLLLTCQKDNAPSIRVIEKNGGVLENEITSPRTGKPALRYWIEL